MSNRKEDICLYTEHSVKSMNNIIRDKKEVYPLTELANEIMKTDYDSNEARDCKWNLCLAFKILGEISIERLEISITRLIMENEAMRSKISVKNGKYYIYDEEFQNCSIVIKQVKSINQAISEAKKYGSIPIDVFNNIPIEVVLFQISHKENLLLLKAHHVITDATSLLLIVKKIIKYYIAPNVEEEPRHGSYYEFMKEEEEFAKTNKAVKEIAFWDQEFAEYKPIRFPIDYSKENGPSYNIARFSFDTKRLQNVARKYKTSVFNVVLTIFHLAFAKINNVSDTALYYLFENRLDPKYRETIGCITRAIANRYTFKENETIESIHKKMRNKISTGFINREKSLRFDHFVSDFVISYQTLSSKRENMKLDECTIEMQPIMLVRKFPWLFIMVTESEEKVSVFFSCDLRKFSEEYLENLKLISLEAEEFVCRMPEKSFRDFIDNSESDFENENIILI